MSYLQRIFIGIIIGLSVSQGIFAYDATYYADSFEGGKTADGSMFSQQYDSAAICNLTLGQYAYVRYGSTGAVVTLNDRPNCTRYPELLDLSKNAFSYFANISQGRISDVSVSPIGENKGRFPKKILPNNIFANIGIELSSPLSNTYFAGDHVLFEGRILGEKKTLLLFLENKTTGEKITKLVPTHSSGRFSFSFALPRVAGDYYLILASGNGFSGVLPQTIRLLDVSTLTYPNIPNNQSSIVIKRVRPDTSISGFSLLRFPRGTWGQLRLQQGNTVDILQGSTIDLSQTILSPGTASGAISLYTLSSPSSLDRSQYFENIWSGSLELDYRRDSTGRENLILRQNRQSVSFRFRVGTGEILDSKYYVTLPNGDVVSYTFPKSVQNEKGYLIPGAWVMGSFPAKENGTYKLEVNRSDGIAWINTPILQGDAWNIIGKFRNNEDKTIRSSLSIVQKYDLARINTLRTGLGRKTLILDPLLSQIAQMKAKDMYTRNYFGHQNPDGQFIAEHARTQGFEVSEGLGENIAAGENVSDIFLQDGLEESPGHRSNMINPRWIKVGIGYFVKDKKIYLVQVFSE